VSLRARCFCHYEPFLFCHCERSAAIPSIHIRRLLRHCRASQRQRVGVIASPFFLSLRAKRGNPQHPYTQIASALSCLAKTESGNVIASPDLSGRGNLTIHRTSHAILYSYHLSTGPSCASSQLLSVSPLEWHFLYHQKPHNIRD